MGAAAYDAWAAFGNFMSNAMMRRAEAKDEDERYAIRAELAEKAQEAREIKREERAAKKVVGRSDAYHMPGAFGADYRVDKLNAAGDPVGVERANPREKQGYQARVAQEAETKRLADEKAKLDAEDRDLNRQDKKSAMSAREIRAQAAVLRAQRTGLTEDTKPDKPLSSKEAHDVLSSARYRTAEGETARDVAKREGWDYDLVLQATNRGAKPKEPTAFERGLNAVGGALSTVAERFKAPAGKSVMAERKPGAKPSNEADVDFKNLKPGQVVGGMKWIGKPGDDPRDPKNWTDA